ncbi:MAG: hypothetical protein GXY61_04590 [Lentisphaerae bacterium]|nr:hypothetical protein [Lentisphaerota bacterium]
MKKWIIAVLVALTVAGCSTTPEKYTLQAFLVSTPTDDFNRVLSSYVMPTSTTYFVSADSTPIPTQPTFAEELVDTLLKNPDAEIIEFPIAYAGIGETVTNAQTEVFQSVLDASVVEGKVVYETEPINVGTSAILTINKVLESGAINFDLEINHCRLSGVDHYTLEEKFDIEMPHFEERSLNTTTNLAPNSWFTMGGLISQREDGTRIHVSFLFRLLPPR